MMSPAIIGPMARARFTCVEFSITAFCTASGGTRSVRNDCQLGDVIAVSTPSTSERLNSTAYP